ncbi:MAG TPA: TolC family protein [Ignavibacteriaceae bacterium]|jgi:outer membrane protein TolC|nr:MAG: Outer membrane protein TolC precursor [Ignavibacteria bacterium ADurb.Bin266]OQY70813.1 MAG: hypothetical protein B6D44_15265 [Ignavibacteriales bacterium UTCHB2]HQF42490.1 TolC family protein [Ignavibacteriaceae bacterium]HQI41753.1 TolC family protein [Ignavibacteriaceae bacterium]
MKHKLSFIQLILFTIIFTTIFSGWKISAQEKIIGIDEAINMALQNNRDILISVMNVKKAGAAVDEAFGYALPSVDLSGNFSHFIKKPMMLFPDFQALLTNATYSILFNENVIPRNNSKFKPMYNILQSFSQSNNFSTGITLTQTLFSSAVFKGIGASKIYYELARADLNSTVSKTVFSVQKTFYGVLLSKKVFEITKQSFDNAMDNLDNVKALYKQGLVSEFDMLQAEVQVENIRPVLLQMENNLKTATDGLKIVLGINQNEEIDVQGEFVYNVFDHSDESDLINEALTENFELKTLELKKQVDEAFIELDVAGYWPTLAAFGQYTYAGSSEKWDFNTYSAATVGLSLSINLWRGNRTKYAVEQSTITYQQTEEQLNKLRDFTILNAKSKLLELKRVESLLDAQQRIVEVAQRAYEIAKVRYKEGAGSQIEIQNSDMALKQARLNLIQITYNYIVAKFELEQILGRTSSEYLNIFTEIE